MKNIREGMIYTLNTGT